MSSRMAIDLFDPDVARKHAQAELRSKMGGPVHFTGRGIDPAITAEVQRKIMEALAKEGAKIRQREEERRKRDPTYREDAIDLSTENLKAYDKYINYYERCAATRVHQPRPSNSTIAERWCAERCLELLARQARGRRVRLGPRAQEGVHAPLAAAAPGQAGRQERRRGIAAWLELSRLAIASHRCRSGLH